MNEAQNSSILPPPITLGPLLTLIVFSLLILVWSQPQPASSTDPPHTIESDATDVTQTGTWTTQTTSNASGGSYLYSSGSPDDTLSLDFYSTRIEVVYVKHPSFGYFTVEIDNNEIRTVTATAEETLFDQRAVFDYLDAGPHTLRIMGIHGVVGIDAFIAAQSQSGIPTATPLPYHGVSTNTVTTPLPTPSLDASSSQSQSLVISACDVKTIVSDVGQLLTAVNTANFDPDSNTVHCVFLQPSTYSFILASGQDAALVINHNINFYGLDYPENVILDGMDQGRIMVIQGGQVEIHHLHLTNSVHQGSSDGYGGAIRMNNGQLVVTDSIFSSNGNMADTNGGGAIFGGGTVTRTQFIGNEAGGGGAIQHPGGGLQITNSCFHNNKAAYGGAILNSDSGAGLNISESSFVGNVFTDYAIGGGGAIFNLSTTYTVEAVGNYWASWNTSLPPVEGPAHSPIRDIPPANVNDPSTFTDTIHGDINLDSEDEGSEDDILTIKPNCLPEIPIDFPDDDVAKPYHIPDIEFDTAFEDLDLDRFPARCQLEVTSATPINLYDHPDNIGTGTILDQLPEGTIEVVPFAYWGGRGGSTLLIRYYDVAEDEYILGWTDFSALSGENDRVDWIVVENRHATIPELANNPFDDPEATSRILNPLDPAEQKREKDLRVITRCENAVYVACRYHLNAPVAVPSDIPGIITRLSEFGISVDDSGFDSSYLSVTPTGIPRAWLYDELLQILQGVETTASAFSIKSGCPDINNLTAPTREEIFQTVMGEFRLIRAEDGFRFGTSHCNGTSAAACTDNNEQVIVFYGAVNITEYVMTHEMGHRFNARSDNGSGRSQDSLYGRLNGMDNDDKYDLQGVFLLGIRSRRLEQQEILPAQSLGVPLEIYANGDTYATDFTRGTRGWGSGPASVYSADGMAITLSFTDFQQNSYSVTDWKRRPGDLDLQTEIDETAADMFLNWVYRNSLITQGFLNRSWQNTTSSIGEIDGGLPAYVRFSWMQQQMQQIWDIRSW